MDIKKAIQERHSVRQYTDKKLDADTVGTLQAEIDRCNAESGLHIQLVTDEPKAFSSFLAHYGRFRGVSNYIVLVGKKSDSNLEEKSGYYGEQLVLIAQALGLNTCWVALTFSKKTTKTRCTIEDDEKLVCVISLGYGATQGVQHKNKPMEALYKADTDVPEWFKDGMEAAILAPTAVNQQKFLFTLTGDKTVKAEALSGSYSKVDLGIVKYHFEVGAGKESFEWA